MESWHGKSDPGSSKWKNSPRTCSWNFPSFLHLKLQLRCPSHAKCPHLSGLSLHGLPCPLDLYLVANADEQRSRRSRKLWVPWRVRPANCMAQKDDSKGRGRRRLIMVCLPTGKNEFNAWGKTVVTQSSTWFKVTFAANLLQMNDLLRARMKWLTFYFFWSKDTLQEAGDQRSMTRAQLWRWSLPGAFFIQHHAAASKISKLPCASRHPVEPQRFLFSTLFAIFSFINSSLTEPTGQAAKPEAFFVFKFDSLLGNWWASWLETLQQRDATLTHLDSWHCEYLL